MSKIQDDFKKNYPPHENKKWPAMLGNLSGVIVAGNGLVYVTTLDGQVLKLPNKIVPRKVQPVLIGYSPDDPYTLRVLSEWEVYAQPMANSLIDHHGNHEYPAFDTVWVKLEQIKWLLCLPAGGFTIQINGGVVLRNGVYTTVPNHTAFVVAAGAFPLSISSPRVRPHILRPPRQDMAGQSTLDPAIVLEGKVGRG